MKPCKFTFAAPAAPIFDGLAHGTKWNGFDNVSVTPTVRDAIVAYLISDDDDPDTINDVRALPIGAGGLVSLAGGFATVIKDDARFPIGQRVEIVCDVELYPIGIFRAGLKGTIVPPDCSDLVVVRLDQHFPELSDWDNELLFGPQTDLSADDYLTPL